ncbi:MAG: hypothetical protein NXI01_01795 [Gammaproteobacteria bacterium]|nr:hypothetical protein [Gammaproteobacteria bacterium]
MITVINLSALAEPAKDTSIPAHMLSYINDNLARQWLSIKAFAELQANYAPPSFVSSILCCGMFGMPTYSYGWILSQIDWNLISQYKIGKMKTKEFLNNLLNVFPFLRAVNFSVEIKETLFKNREDLISIRDLSSLEELTHEHVALSLLEQAWLARMQFSEETNRKIQYFFDENPDDPVYIISNSNEMDCSASIKYLHAKFPSLPWRSNQELDLAIQVPDQALNAGIPLTTDGRLKLYASYTHQAFKTGHADETNMTTDKLLRKLVEQEEINVDQITLISQWRGDREMAKSLNIKEVIDSKIYFSPTELNEIKPKVE